MNTLWYSFGRTTIPMMLTTTTTSADRRNDTADDEDNERIGTEPERREYIFICIVYGA